MANLANIDLILLFFFLGALASWLKSDLQIPDSVSKFLSIFLLLSLGLKGGHEVRVASDLSGFGLILSLGLASCLFLPIYLFFLYRRKIGAADATAIASCYGSVSAVTFVAAQGSLESAGIAVSGYMVAVMALMEIPAIVVALYLYQKYKAQQVSAGGDASKFSLFSSKSVVLLLGGFVIGLLMNEPSWLSIKPVVKDSFKGVLAFFLLDLGFIAQKQLHQAWAHKWKALLIAMVQPILHGAFALTIAHYLGVEQGNQVVLAVLVGSASYIAAPAAIRSAIPMANPSLYVALPLALTFPMNILVGIPFYIELSRILSSI